MNLCQWHTYQKSLPKTGTVTENRYRFLEHLTYNLVMIFFLVPVFGRINALDQWCLCMLLAIKWYQFVRNDNVRGLTKQPKLTTIIQSCRLTLFGHIMRMDDTADAKRILLVPLPPPVDWRRQPGRPRITWLSAIQQDLKHHHLTLPEAADLAQNCRLWRMMSTYGAIQS